MNPYRDILTSHEISKMQKSGAVGGLIRGWEYVAIAVLSVMRNPAMRMHSPCSDLYMCSAPVMAHGHPYLDSRFYHDPPLRPRSFHL